MQFYHARKNPFAKLRYSKVADKYYAWDSNFEPYQLRYIIRTIFRLTLYGAVVLNTVYFVMCGRFFLLKEFEFE